MSDDSQKSADPVVELEIVVHLCDDDGIKGAWGANNNISYNVYKNVFPTSGVGSVL